jgi:hypothetical protein
LRIAALDNMGILVQPKYIIYDDLKALSEIKRICRIRLHAKASCPSPGHWSSNKPGTGDHAETLAI